MLKKILPLALGGLLSLCCTTASLAAVESANYPRAPETRCRDVHERGGQWTPSKGPLILSGRGNFEIEFYGDGLDNLPESDFRLNGQTTGRVSVRNGHSGPNNAISGCGGIGSRVVALYLDGSATRQTGSLRIGGDVVPLNLIPGSTYRLDWSSDNENPEPRATPTSTMTDAQKRAHDAPLITQAVNTCLTNMASRAALASGGGIIVQMPNATRADCSGGRGYLLPESANEACNQIKALGYTCSTVIQYSQSTRRPVTTLGSCISRAGGSASLSADTLTLIIPARTSTSSLSNCFVRGSYLEFYAQRQFEGIHFLGDADPIIGMQISTSPGAPTLSYTQNTEKDVPGGFFHFAAASLRDFVGVYSYNILPSGEGSRPLTLVLMSDPANAVKTLAPPLYAGTRMTSNARLKALLFQPVRQGQSFDVALTNSDVSSCFEQNRIQITPPVGATSFDVDFKYTEATGCVGKSVSLIATAVGYPGLEATATFTIAPLDAPRNQPPQSSVTKARNSILNQN